jgi:hypothetical protein
VSKLGFDSGSVSVPATPSQDGAGGCEDGAPPEEQPAGTYGRPPFEPLSAELSAMLALVDEIAVLAADLWFAGKLDGPPTNQDRPHEDDA